MPPGFRSSGTAAMIRLAGFDGIGGLLHAFFTRQGGVSNGLVRLAELRFRVPRRRRPHRAKPRHRDGDAGFASRSTGDLPPNPQRRGRERRRTVAPRQRAGCRRHGYAGSGRGARRSGGRLRTAVAVRSDRARDRRRTCRLARCSRKAWPKPPSKRWSASAPNAAASASGSALASALLLTRSVPNFRRRLSPKIPPRRRTSHPQQRAGHFMFDLAAYVEHRLHRFGVRLVERALHDTAAEPELFFSYRRARLRGEPVFGLGLSAIAID